MYRGTLTVTETADGEITPADDPNGSPEIENLLVRKEHAMTASVEAGRERFDGTIEVPNYGVTTPFGERQNM